MAEQVRVQRLGILALVAATAALWASPAWAQCGTRWVTKSGSDAGNNCLTAATPCRTINYAVTAACANDAVEVGEGTWTEDVLINKAVFVDSSGNNANTILRGTGANDIVRILASGAQLNGFAVNGQTGGRACVRIGDAAHTGLRTIQLTNLNVSNCTTGVYVDSIGATGDWVRVNGNIISSHVANGTAAGGVGVYMTGGVGRIEVRQNTMASNGGAAIKLAAGANGTLEIAGDTISNSALAATSTGRAGIEIHGGTDVRIEGNLLTGHTGLAAVDDGRAVLIDGANGVEFFCNEMKNNDGGVSLGGTLVGMAALQNRFFTNSGPAVEVAAPAASGLTLNESMIYSNGKGVVNTDTVAVNARHNWWGNASGPTGGGGTGDSIIGPVDASNFIARTLQPVLARAPKTSGWSRSTAACYDTLQAAINAAPATSLVLIGAGEIAGHVTMSKVLDLEGVPGEVMLPYCDHCYAAVVDGTQLTSTLSPAMTISNVSGISVKYLTFHGAGVGTPACFGGHTESEVGLDLFNVKNSLFLGIDLRENGTTDLRVRGDSDDNVFDTVYIDGMIRDGDNEDRCGHRSREGFLFDGGARACEGGGGVRPERNVITNSQTYHITHSIRLRYADGTEIKNSQIHGVPSDEWPDPYAYNIWVEGSNNTYIHDNPAIGNRGVHTALLVLGGSSTCETTDSTGTRVENTTFDMIDNSGYAVHLRHQPGDNGAPVNTQVSCSTISGAWKGVVAEVVNGSSVTQSDIVSSTTGMENSSAETLPAQRNWWGAASGPSGAGPGTGSSVSTGIDFSNFLGSSSRDDADHDGYTECQGDPNDANPTIHPNDTCDGIDNDLDGTIDEDFQVATTHCGTGPCSATGVTSCVNGVVLDSCTPLPAPSPTDATCDNVDDNCNGQVDEGYPQTPTSCGTGACARTGAIACVNGTVQDTCAPGNPISPDDPTCNSVDDNCNGQADENFTPAPSTCGTGACASTGMTSCSNGVPGDSCVPNPPLSPVDTTCDNVDDNCNGQVDEGFATQQTSCGVGVCASTGATSCLAGQLQDSCVPNAPNTPDDASCNGLDDNCNGVVDEDWANQPTVCGRGVCAVLGSIVCQGGQPVEQCTPGTPGMEVCNGLDDDCDGTADNNIPVPSGPATISATRVPDSQSTEITWAAVPAAQTYDLQRGQLSVLLATGGDFSQAAEHCIVDNIDLTTWRAPDVPDAGDGYFYLVRASNCIGVGSYDVGENGLVASRDASIGASPNACP